MGEIAAIQVASQLGWPKVEKTRVCTSCCQQFAVTDPTSPQVKNMPKCSPIAKPAVIREVAIKIVRFLSLTKLSSSTF